MPDVNAEQLPGVYLDVRGREEIMVTTGLNASGLKLLKFEPPTPEENQPSQATVFATPKGLENLQKKIADFETKNSTKRDGTEGRPRNANLVQSIDAIIEAGLRQLWRSPETRFPDGNEAVHWEIWLDNADAERFLDRAGEFDVEIAADRIEFPEDIVVVAFATQQNLALAIRRLAGVKALAAPTTAPEFFDSLAPEEQAEWVQNLLERITYHDVPDPAYISLLDSGVSLAHPLISPALSDADRYAADPAWGPEDQNGHGTQMAGLALLGDLNVALQSAVPIDVSHRLESAKIIPDVGQNPHHLLGAITRRAVDAIEVEADRRRIFSLASTTDTDTPHDGAPTSWSSEIDQLAAGVSGVNMMKRLILVSAGNSDQNLFTNDDYLATCDDDENEIESPAQAWNAICVGAYTEKSLLPPPEPGVALAPIGDLAPSSRTASWTSHWPLKPDVVFESDNWVVDGMPPPMKHHALSLLTTDHQYPARSFATCGDTSAATSLAAKAISSLVAEYPELWPETIRAIIVSSARWNTQMLSHLPANARKGDYTALFTRYGYGVPDMERAHRSASNALTLIVQDQITPYRNSDARNADPIINEMKIFELPWPTGELRRLGNSVVTLRVALSTFVEPNPSEAARGTKFRYASHNLRFKLKRADENDAQFLARINKASEQVGSPVGDVDDGWKFGSNRRDVGSLHVDELTCIASDLARRNLVAVHPVGGWWKSKSVDDLENKSARFSLVVEIDAEEVEADLYGEVQIALEQMNLIVNPV